MDSSSTPDPARRRSAGALVRQLSIGASVWVAVLGLTVASVSAWQYWRTSLESIDDRLMTDAHALVGRIVVSSGLLEIDIDAVPGGVESSADDYQAVYDAAGRLLYATSPVVPDTLTPAPGIRTRDGYREVLVQGPVDSVVVVGESLETVRDDVRRLAASVSLASLAGVALTLPLAVWLRRQLARSIRQIDQTARALAPGQPTRIDVARVADEFVGVAGALNSAFDRLDEAIARERQLTSDASHELRTPVTTLVAEAQWALGRPRTAGEYRQSLEVCARQGARMKDLVENLLTLARLDAGTLPPARDHVHLRPVVEEAAAELNRLARDHRVSVHLDGDAVAWADAVQMRILVSNLLSNAIRYNTVDGEVVAEMTTAGDSAIFRVRDTGAGIDPDFATRVFERFWRATPARSTRDGGSGLGLAICKAIVETHDGHISIESASGRGTTIHVVLPVGSTSTQMPGPPDRKSDAGSITRRSTPVPPSSRRTDPCSP